jgi:hypothetical protein
MYICMMFPMLGFLKTEGKTPEDALARMQDEMKVPLTYRPADGTVYIHMDHIPRGVVFQKVNK